MSKIYYILFLFCLSACAKDAPRQGYLTSDPIIKLHFNKYQIKDLENIMAFFETQICGTFPTTPEAAQNCYNNYLTKLAEHSNIGEMALFIPIASQENTLDSIRPVTFDAIWENEPQIQDSISVDVFSLKYGGQYNNFLNSLAKENQVVKQYVDVFNQRGSITSSMIANVLLNHQDIDLSKQRGRLFITIHYLTLNKMFAESAKNNLTKDSF